MHHSTRQEILTMLKTIGPMTVSDMAKMLDITEMAVRRHLNTLERDDYVETTLVRQAMGRPTNVYRLAKGADAFFPRNYSDLTIDFLKDLEVLEGEEKIKILFKRRKDRLLKDIKHKMRDMNLEEKVSYLAKSQDQKGYMVELEKTEEGNYTLKEYNCPISQVAKEYTIACDCELQLFEEALGVKVERNVCYAKGGVNCVFSIRTTEPLSK